MNAPVVAAAEALLAAAKELPSGNATKEQILAALRKYDLAEIRLDDAIDAYMAGISKGKGT